MPQIKQPSKKICFSIASVLLSALVFLGLGEVAFRLQYYWNPHYAKFWETAQKARSSSIWERSLDPELIYTHRKDYWRDGIRYTDHRGLLHSDDIHQEKRLNDFRIAIVGDSIAAGLSLPYEDRLSSQLETALKVQAFHNRSDVEVVNFGVNGYRTIQEARLIETFVSEFNPDLLVLQYCMNDPGNSYNPTVWFAYDRPQSYFLSEIRRKLQMLSRPQDSAYAPVWGPGYGSLEYWYALYAPESQSWRSVERGFQRIDAYARKNQIPVMLVIYPFLLDTDEGYARSKPFHDQVHHAGMLYDWIIVDLLDTFYHNSIHKSIKELQETADDIYHPNAKGHYLAVAAIVDKLKMLNATR